MTAGRAGVVVVGAINVDLVVAAPRLPGPGETVVGARLERHGGGKGANAAVAAARAGGAVRLVGAVGSDDNGTAALDDLRAAGVDVGDVAVLKGEPTGVALIVVDPEGENQIAVGAGANAAVTSAHVHRALGAALPTAGCVLVSTEIAGEAVAAAVEEAARAGVFCVLNPAPAIPAVLEALRHGPVLTPNATEVQDLARLLAGTDEGRPAEHDDASPPARDHVIAAAERLMAATGAPVVVTLGGDGALVLAPGAAPAHVPPRPATVRDTTGAGDTFNGVLAVRLAAGDELAAAVHTASAAAALSVSRVGARAGMPDAEAIAAAMAASAARGESGGEA
jgi:ribokinase